MIANTNTTKVFFNPANPDCNNSLDVRVVRGILDLFRYYRKLGLKNSASEMRDYARSYIKGQREILSVR